MPMFTQGLLRMLRGNTQDRTHPHVMCTSHGAKATQMGLCKFAVSVATPKAACKHKLRCNHAYCLQATSRQDEQLHALTHDRPCQIALTWCMAHARVHLKPELIPSRGLSVCIIFVGRFAVELVELVVNHGSGSCKTLAGGTSWTNTPSAIPHVRLLATPPQAEQQAQ